MHHLNKNINQTNIYSNRLELLSNALNVIELGISIMDADGIFIETNDAYCKNYGYEKYELLGKSFLMLEDPNDHEKLLKEHYEFMEKEYSFFGEKPIIQKSGKMTNILVKMAKITDSTGKKYKITYITGTTSRRKTEIDVKKFMMAVGQTVDWVLITNKDGIIEYANESVERITGYKVEEILGNTPAIWKSDKYNTDVYNSLWRTILQGVSYRSVIVNRKKDGQLFYLDQSISPLKDEDGEILYFVSTGKDITENKRMEDRLNCLYHYDILTGLSNRVAFCRMITQEITNAELEDGIVAIMIMDINKFIFVNETFGTEVGDMALKTIGNRLLEVAGKENIVARMGGDEFGIILKGVRNSGDVFIYIDKIFRAVEQSIRIKDQEFVLTMSMGISIYPNDGENMKQLLSKAEIALSQARRSESIKYMFYDEHMNTDAKNYLTMENKLLKALKKEEFILFYQPYFNLKTYGLEGFEALLRWRDQEGRIISPGIFIPVLEESGLIREVGRQIIKKVCCQLRQWIDKGLSIVPIAINLSPIQFRNSSLLSDIMNVIEEYKIDPKLIVFEITESTFMQDIGTTYEILRNMKSMGFTISIDDFGTGYSSLSYLKKFPVDHLKIDLSFIRDITKDEDDKAIVNAIISMAHDLNLKTIAEGIEEEEQLNELFHLKCDIGQGYYWSKPIPPEDVEKFFV